ncbi:MAG: hypothetical protein IPJ77_00105 [Planctomycetes bacterium]|nr:hypothetical protein [Planctomycetota bacterium]
MRSRWPWIVVLCVLAALGVVGWTTRAPKRPSFRAFDAQRGRAAIEQFFADTRSGALPKVDPDGMPVPWGVPFASEEHRRAWEIHLATVAPRLAALDALHDDPNVQGVLRIGDGVAVLEHPLRIGEYRCFVNELSASAVLALDRGDFDAALRRAELMLEIALTFRDRADGQELIQAGCADFVAWSLDASMQHARWDAARAFGPLALRVRAILEDQERSLGPGRALDRRVDGVAFALQSDEATVENAFWIGGRVEEGIELSIARGRVLLLALAADAFRAEHGRWPASTSELSNLLAADELACSLVPEPLDLAPDGPNLRVGLIHSKRPPNEAGTTLLLVR